MGIGMVSSLFSGLAQRKAGQQEQAAYNYNAAIDLQNMSDQMIATQQSYTQLVGRQASAYAAAGVDITRGSPLLMMVTTAGRGGRQEEQIREAGTEKATLEQYYGRLAAWRGNIQGIGTFLSGLDSSATAYLRNTGYVPGGGDFVPSNEPQGA
jgi:hypothetical protein